MNHLDPFMQAWTQAWGMPTAPQGANQQTAPAPPPSPAIAPRPSSLRVFLTMIGVLLLVGGIALVLIVAVMAARKAMDKAEVKTPVQLVYTPVPTSPPTVAPPKPIVVAPVAAATLEPMPVTCDGGDFTEFIHSRAEWDNFVRIWGHDYIWSRCSVPREWDYKRQMAWHDRAAEASP